MKTNEMTAVDDPMVGGQCLEEPIRADQLLTSQVVRGNTQDWN